MASNKVEGTPVFARDGYRLGSIKNVMIDKYAGTARYAVLSHSSGFLGLNEDYLPVEWDELRYDERRDGYRINMTEEQVRMRIDRERSSARRYGRMREREEGRDWERR
ncbi:PRC-barrel domain-containing protein [Sphingomonas sp. GCM10030256]|uniref:PRC-barrel domain-containing protein n=1 Tax=Sphingomonas sp. GCM10030256 TaxID=3273427 RepID=UPI00361EB396